MEALRISAAVLLVLALAYALDAPAKCSIRAADPLITARYRDCKPREFLSYLYNDLVTPFSFDCAKKVSETCREENCDRPRTPDDRQRCLGRYAEILSACNRQIDDAARMARCKDTKAWPVESVAMRSPSGAARETSLGGESPAPPKRPTASGPAVRVEPLPADWPFASASVRASQSARAP